MCIFCSFNSIQHNMHTPFLIYKSLVLKRNKHLLTDLLYYKVIALKFKSSLIFLTKPKLFCLNWEKVEIQTHKSLPCFENIHTFTQLPQENWLTWFLFQDYRHYYITSSDGRKTSSKFRREAYTVGDLTLIALIGNEKEAENDLQGNFGSSINFILHCKIANYVMQIEQ